MPVSQPGPSSCLTQALAPSDCAGHDTFVRPVLQGVLCAGAHALRLFARRLTICTARLHVVTTLTKFNLLVCQTVALLTASRRQNHESLHHVKRCVMAVQVLGEDLVLVKGQQDRMAQGADVWAHPVAYDKLGVRYRRWRNSLTLPKHAPARQAAEEELAQTMSAGAIFATAQTADVEAVDKEQAGV